jgi:hypothetical protein
LPKIHYDLLGELSHCLLGSNAIMSWPPVRHTGAF